MFLSLLHILLRQKGNLSNLWYWYSLNLDIIFLIFYWTSYFINTLRHLSVIEWIYAIPLACMTLCYWCHSSLSRNLPTALGCLIQAFLVPLKFFFLSSPKMKGLVLDTDSDNCSENVSKSPATWPAPSKIADLYVLENHLLLKKWAIITLH